MENDKPLREARQMSLPDLAVYIEEHYHESLRRTMPCIAEEFERLLAAAGQHAPPVLIAAQEAFIALREALEDHLVFEEDIVFPYIHRLAQERPPDEERAAEDFTARIRRQHAQAEEARYHLYVAASAEAFAAGPFEELGRRLMALAAEMAEHMRIEDEVLFARLCAWESECRPQR